MSKNILWTQDEIDSLIDYEAGSDAETLAERLEHARYMNHVEGGLSFPNRSLSAVTNKFYEECKRRRALYTAAHNL